MHRKDKRAKAMNTWYTQVQSYIDVTINSSGSSVERNEQFVPLFARC